MDANTRDAGTCVETTTAMASAALLLLAGLAPLGTASTHDVVLELSLSGPQAVPVGQATTYTGALTLADQGVPGQEITVRKDGQTAGTTTTGLDGTYSFQVAFTTEGTHTLQTVVYEGTALETTSPLFEVQVGETDPDGITIEIQGASAERQTDQVHVWVTVGGTVTDDGDGVAGAPVDGEVTVTKENPCWDDVGGCVEVIDRQTRRFETTTASDGSYEATVGPFTYEAQGTGPTCNDLHVDATAGHGGGEERIAGQDDQTLTVCA